MKQACGFIGGSIMKRVKRNENENSKSAVGNNRRKRGVENNENG
jgi:hypothetical protein